jgi:hypothetical protein
MRKRWLAAAACAVALTGLSAGSAFGGEVNGTGEYIAGSDNAPLNGRSACAF